MIERFSTAGMLTEELDAQLTGDLSSDLRFLAHTYLKTALERAEYIRLGIMEASRKELAHTLGEIPKQLTSHLADYFRKLHQQGVICEADYMLMAHIFYGMLFQSVENEPRRRSSPSKPTLTFMFQHSRTHRTSHP